MINFLIPALFFSYFLGPFQVFAIGTYGVTYYDLTQGLIYAIVLMKFIWNGESKSIKWHPTATILLFLYIAVLFSSISPIFFHNSLPSILQYIKSASHFVFYSSLVLVFILYPVKPETWINGLKVWIIIGFILNIFGIYQIFARAYDLPLAWISYNNISFSARGAIDMSEGGKQLSLNYGNFFRATSIFTEPSALAGFNLDLIAILFMPYIQGKKPILKSKFFTILSLVVNFLTLFLTFSMTGLVGFFLIVFVALLVEKGRRVRKLLAYLVLFGIFIVATDSIVNTYLGTSVLDLFTKRTMGMLTYGSENRETTSGDSMSARVGGFNEGVKIWRSSPLFGVGIGCDQYSGVSNTQCTDFSITDVMAGMGIIGGLPFVLLFITLFGYYRKVVIGKYKTNHLPENFDTILNMQLYFIVIQVLTNFITANVYISPVLWLPVAMMVSLSVSYEKTFNETNYKFAIVGRPLKAVFGDYMVGYLKFKTKKI